MSKTWLPKIGMKSVLVAVTLAAGSLGLTASPAAADTVRITAGVQHGGPMQLAQRYDPRGYCSPRQAARKAVNMGLRRAVVVRNNRQAVVVDGRKRGRLVTIRFAQARGCPVIAIR